MARVRSGPAKGAYELPPEGAHIAVCYESIDFGTQTTKYGDKPQIRLGFELSEEKMADGRPFQVSRTYNNSIGVSYDSQFKSDLESWRGKRFTAEELADGFDTDRLVGIACVLNIIHKQVGDKTYANISSIGGLPKGMQKPQMINKPLIWNFDKPDRDAFNNLPQWMQELIMRTPEWKEWTSPKEQVEKKEEPEFDDDIPF